MKHIITTAILLLMSSMAMAQDNIVVVLDTSGSMDNGMRQMRGMSRQQVAHDALTDVLSKLSKNTNIGVLTFRGWVYDFGPVDPQKIQSVIPSKSDDTSTPLWANMKIAADKLLEVRKANNNVGRYKIVVVTDGEANDDDLAVDTDWRGNPKKIPGYLTDIMNRGIIVDAIGVDMATKHSLSTRINGAYMRGDDPQSLKESVSKAVAEVAFDDSKGADDFQMIAEMPEDFAFAVVASLSNFQNQPIGEEPEAVVFVEETGELVPKSQAPALAVEQYEDAVGEIEPEKGGFNVFALLGMLVVASFVVVILVVLFRGVR